MITLKQFMEVVNYRITEGSDYGWNCYGSNAYTLDSWDGDQDGSSFSIIIDTVTQAVYEVQVHDYKNQRSYRFINPEYKAAHDAEAVDRGINPNEAWDDVSYVDLETVEDWLDKAEAIFAGVDYDTRVQVPLTVDDDTLFQMMKLAHERDITLNQLVEEILREKIADNERN